MNIPTLEGQRIRLVRLGIDVLGDMFEYSRMPEFYTYMELAPHKTIEDTSKYLDKLLRRVENGNSLYWAVRLKDTNKMIGTLGVVDIDLSIKKAQIGYGISPLFWKRGFFKEALLLVLEYCFNELGLDKIFTITFLDNLASIGGLKHCGFHYEKSLPGYYHKHDGSIHDAVMFSILKVGFVSKGSPYLQE